MAKQQPIERARDELFSHIHRCGVLKAAPADQDSWMTETMEYLAERYPDLGEKELFHLKSVGLQFCKPVISRLKIEEPKEEAEDAVEEVLVSTEEMVSTEEILGEPREA